MGVLMAGIWMGGVDDWVRFCILLLLLPRVAPAKVVC